MGDKIEVTKDELESLISAGVEKEKLSILIDDFKGHKIEEEKRYAAIAKNTEAIFSMVRNFPDKISQCQDEIENDIHSELEKYYATKADVSRMVLDMESRIDKLAFKFKWTTGAIVTVAGTIQFAMTVWYLGLQITKITTGG